MTAKTARTLAMQEFGTARGLTKSTSFVGVYFMEFGNLRIEICADTACIAVRVVLAHGTGSSVKYFDPDTLQENFKAIDKHREDEDRAIISDWVNLNGPEYCRKQVEAIWNKEVDSVVGNGKYIAKEATNGVIYDSAGQIAHNGLLEICPFCGEMNNHFGSGGSVNIWTVGAIERRSVRSAESSSTKSSLTVPPDETPEAFYLRVIKAVTA